MNQLMASLKLFLSCSPIECEIIATTIPTIYRLI